MNFSDEEEQRKKLESRINRFKSSEDENRDKGNFTIWKGLYLVGSLGFVVAASLLIGLGLGNYLDKRWSTAPWLTLTGLILGFGAAILGGYELIRSSLKDKS